MTSMFKIAHLQIRAFDLCPHSDSGEISKCMYGHGAVSARHRDADRPTLAEVLQTRA
jgi:hypothetical protein